MSDEKQELHLQHVGERLSIVGPPALTSDHSEYSPRDVPYVRGNVLRSMS